MMTAPRACERALDVLEHRRHARRVADDHALDPDGCDRARLELRLHEQRRSRRRRAAARRAARRARLRSEMKERSATTTVDRGPSAPGSRCGRCAARCTATRGVVAQPRVELPVPDVDGDDRAAPRCSRQSVKPPVDAPASSARSARDVDRECDRARRRACRRRGCTKRGGARAARSAQPPRPSGSACRPARARDRHQTRVDTRSRRLPARGQPASDRARRSSPATSGGDRPWSPVPSCSPSRRLGGRLLPPDSRGVFAAVFFVRRLLRRLRFGVELAALVFSGRLALELGEVGLRREAERRELIDHSRRART